jgi:hypothetical protein
MTKAKTKMMPGKERPAASRLVIQRPLTTKLHPKIMQKHETVLSQPIDSHEQ